MKRKLMVLVILIIFFAILILIRFFVFDNPGKLGRLKVLSSPTAGIFIDDAATGKTPFETRLAPGEYGIKLIPEGENTQTVTWEGRVKVYANALTYVSREMGTTELTSAGEVLTVTKMKESASGNTGQVAIETAPAGAIIFLDNDEKGVAPLLLDGVTDGDHELAVYLPGFFRRSQKINVEKGYVVNAAFKLGLDKTHKTLEQELEEKKKEASESAAIETTPTPGTAAKKVKILETPTGFLNVRETPSVAATKITEVSPGDVFDYSEEKGGWYLIALKDGDRGWVSGEYVEKVKN